MGKQNYKHGQAGQVSEAPSSELPREDRFEMSVDEEQAAKTQRREDVDKAMAKASDRVKKMTSYLAKRLNISESKVIELAITYAFISLDRFGAWLAAMLRTNKEQEVRDHVDSLLGKDD